MAQFDPWSKVEKISIPPRFAKSASKAALTSLSAWGNMRFNVGNPNSTTELKNVTLIISSKFVVGWFGYYFCSTIDSLGAKTSSF